MTADEGAGDPRARTAVQLGTVAFAIVGVVWLATSLPSVGGMLLGSPDDPNAGALAFYLWSSILLNASVGVGLLFGSRALSGFLFRDLKGTVIVLSPYDLTRTALVVLGLVLVVGGLTSLVTGFPPVTYYPTLEDTGSWIGTIWLVLGGLLILESGRIMRTWRALALRGVAGRERHGA